MKSIYKRNIVWGLLLSVCISGIYFGVYALVNNWNYYVFDPHEDVCITWNADGTKYAMTYDPPVQISLFVPKNTEAERLSFLQAANNPNSFYVNNVYRYDQDDYYWEICGSYNNCAYWTTFGAWYDDEAPVCSERWFCDTPCGIVTCWGPCS